MSEWLKTRDYHVERCKASIYMNELDIYPIYQKINLTKQIHQATSCFCILCNADIDESKGELPMTLPIFPIRYGFLELTAMTNCYRALS